MHYLYGRRSGVLRRLVATFGSEQQLLAYVGWATLKELGDHAGRFEQGSVLAAYNAWENSTTPLTDEDPNGVIHNPSPNML